MTVSWRERALNPNAHVEREDGRVCHYVQAEVTMTANKAPLAAPRVMLAFRCRDDMPLRVVSLIHYWPTPTEDPVTCLKCLAAPAERPALVVEPWKRPPYGRSR